MTPRLSIGLPVYNGERYLAQALDSLLAQTFSDFELIICDNASTDSTAEICRRYTEADARVRYHRHGTNIGAARNFQSTLHFARAPLFKWASADDLCLPEFLERCVAALAEDRDAVLAFPSTVLIDGDGKLLDFYEDIDIRDETPAARFDRVLATIERCNAQYGVVYTDVLRRTGGMRSYNSGDVVLLAELALYGKLVRLPERLFYRRMHPSASSAMDDSERAEFYNPGHGDRIKMYRWKMAGSLLAVAWRSPVGIATKYRTLSVVLRHVRWARYDLWRELRDSVRCWVRSRRRQLGWGAAARSRGEVL